MRIIYVDYLEFRTNIILKGFPLNYKTIKGGYEVFSLDRSLVWTTNVISEDDKLNFETYYKDKCNICIYDESGKPYNRAESRPLNTFVSFICRADSESNIGDGKILSWDFGNEDDEISAPEGFRRKRLEFKFLDNIWLKEGTLYYYNMPKGSYGNLYIVAPAGTPYYDNNHEVQVALEDTPIVHYVVHHMVEGSVPMGDELNAECCSEEIPNFYKCWIEITIPEQSGTIAHGHASLEIYRKRTMIL